MSTEVELQKIAGRLRELNQRYELASQGLKSGSTGVGLVFVVVLFAVAIAAFTHVYADQPLFTGSQVVWIIGILVVGLLAYFAMVYGRELGVRRQVSRNDDLIEEIELIVGKSTEV